MKLFKSKKQWSLGKFTFKKLNNLAVISNFLAFFLFLVDKFTLLDPDLDPQPCGTVYYCLIKVCQIVILPVPVPEPVPTVYPGICLKPLSMFVD